MAEMIACAEPYDQAEQLWSTMMFDYIPHYEHYSSSLKKPYGYDPSKMIRPIVGDGISLMGMINNPKNDSMTFN